MHKKVCVLSGLLICVSLSIPAYAWENHSDLTAVAIRNLPEIQQAKPATVESIESFINAEKQGLTRLLDEQETWAKTNVPTYPQRPGNLRFDDAPGSASELKERFLKALRVNPNSKAALYLQKIHGTETEGSVLPVTDVTLLSLRGPSPFVALEEGSSVSAAEIVATAADEPDYGLDIGLWEDNGTAFGKVYGFGKQPFGNPALDFGTQAPFHMGFYHESAIVYKAAGFLKKTYPELRIYQFLTLARFAFQTGHTYWGWRFAGWGMHYLQDLTQPYHSQVLPGLSVPKMLLINILDMIGYNRPKNDRVQLVSNRHLALENFAYNTLVQILEQKNQQAPLIQTLSDISADGRYPKFSFSTPRELISAEAASWSSDADRILRKNLPRVLVSDPTYIFGVTDPDVDVLLILKNSGQNQSLQNMETLLINLMKQLGPQSRQYLRSALN